MNTEPLSRLILNRDENRLPNTKRMWWISLSVLWRTTFFFFFFVEEFNNDNVNKGNSSDKSSTSWPLFLTKVDRQLLVSWKGSLYVRKGFILGSRLQGLLICCPLVLLLHVRDGEKEGEGEGRGQKQSMHRRRRRSSSLVLVVCLCVFCVLCVYVVVIYFVCALCAWVWFFFCACPCAFCVCVMGEFV